MRWCVVMRPLNTTTQWGFCVRSEVERVPARGSIFIKFISGSGLFGEPDPDFDDQTLNNFYMWRNKIFKMKSCHIFFLGASIKDFQATEVLNPPKRTISTSQREISFLLFCGSLLPLLRDPNPRTQLNSIQIRVRIRNIGNRQTTQS